MKHFFAGFFATLGLLFTAGNSSGQWVSSNGPYGWYINSLAVAGTDLYAAAYNYGGSVFLSTDNGSNWAIVNNNLPESNHVWVTALAVTGDYLFAGTHNEGRAASVYISTDNGSDWKAAQVGLPTGTDINALVIAGTQVFAATDSGVYLSADDGLTWGQVNNGLTNTDVNCLAVSGNDLFAGTSVGVFLSTDQGSAWTPINNGLPNVVALAVGNGNLFAATNGGLFLSTNNGSSWSLVDDDSLNAGAVCIAGTNVLAGTNRGLFLSTDNGSHWAQAAKGLPELNSGLVDYGIGHFAISGTDIFAGTANGVFLSTDNGFNWSPINSGPMNRTKVYSLGVTSHGFFAGILGGTFRSTDDGSNWQQVSNVNAVCFAVSDSDLFMGDGGIHSSTDNGSTWTSNLLTNQYGVIPYNVNAIAVSGTNLFAGTFGGVFLSTDNGSSWTAVSNGLPINYAGVPSVAALAVNGKDLFAGTFGGVFLSTDNGSTWVAVNNGLSTTDPVYRLAVSGSSLFAGTDSAGVFVSTDGGSSWTSASNGLTSNSILSFAVCGTNIFAGTDGGGVFLSTDKGLSWAQVNDGLPGGISVSALAANGKYLLAGTWEAGVFVRPLSQMIGPFPPAAPVPISPVYTTGVPRLPTYIWRSSPSATQYHLQVSPDTGFSSIVVDTTLQDTTVQVLDTLAPNMTYNWRVSALNAGVEGQSLAAFFVTGTGILGVEQRIGIPKHYSLSQNYPNPFNPTTIIQYDVPIRSQAVLAVYDVLGRKVATLVDGEKLPGHYQITFDASSLSSGVYFYRLDAGTYHDTKKLLLLK